MCLRKDISHTIAPLSDHKLVCIKMSDSHDNPRLMGSGGQSTQIKYLSKSTDTYNKILLQ